MSNTRICVKNLPKHLTEKRFKEHFGKFGEITDCKIAKTAEGKSRLFGFIGFTNDNSTKNALSLNNTYLDTSKITVEKAFSIDKSDAARPWSKYSEGSSSHKKINEKEEETSKSSKKSDDRKRKLEDAKDRDELDNDEDFQKFKNIMNPRINQAIWDDGDGSKTNIPDSSKKKRKIVMDPKENKDLLMFEDDEEDEDDQLYDEMPAEKPNKTKIEVEKKEEVKLDTTVNDSSINDLDWLKSKVTSKVEEEQKDEEMVDNDEEDDEEDEDDEEEEKENKNSEVEGDNKKEKKEKDTKFFENDFKEETEKKETEKDSKFFENDFKDEAEQVGESGRIFIRNLSHTVKEVDLENLFQQFGKISEIHLPIDNETKKIKGFAFILFLIPENAVRAMSEMDGKVNQGRIMHIIPAKSAPVKMRVETEKTAETSSFKKDKEEKQKNAAGSTHNWNALFMRSDTIVSSLSERYKISQGEVLDIEDSSDLAVKMTLMETHIINETKKFLEDNGVIIDYIGDKNMKRSNTTILIKNIPFKTNERELSELFSKFGETVRILLTPAKTIGLVEFDQPNEAKIAFKALAYSKFHHVPLYLEWAPIGLFKINAPTKKDKQEEQDKIQKEDTKKLLDNVQNNIKNDQALFYVFIKNLNWDTTEDILMGRMKSLKHFKSVKIATKVNPKGGARLSCGYGFAEFSSKQGAYECIRSLNGSTIDGHEVSFKISDKTASINNEEVQSKNNNKSDRKSNKSDSNINDKSKISNKINVKNIPFEASIKELRKLFSAYGEIQSIRLPKKPSGSHRGFGFIEFLTEEEAKTAIESLKNSHFYGRHLILSYAEQDKNIDELREKANLDYEKLKSSKY